MHDHGHSHQHGAIPRPTGHADRAGARHAGRLKAAFVLIAGFLVVQVVVGLSTNSLALLSDAGHMATDALGLGMALAAITAANRAAEKDDQEHRTFGLYRLEILAALANAVLLFAVAGYVLVEAVIRLNEPRDITSVPVFVVGVIGLVVNVIAFLLLREGAAESMNVRGAYLEVVSDMLGSVGVIVSAALLWATEWHWVDPVVGAAIGLFILPRAFRLGRDAVRVLVQAAPPELDVHDIEHTLLSIDGVTGVHDLHVWTLTSEMHVLSAHVRVGDESHSRRVLTAAQAALAERYGLSHATLQIECDDCNDVGW
ncbi:MAG: cation diffusion facilitator family transporter [Ilumatobacteraceae bacterium]